MIKISEFQVKDIVNTLDGKRLGNVGNIDINLHTGRIDSITVRTEACSFLNKEEEIVIPWNKIKMIGEDVILVEYRL